jgi:hypothetical protein
VGWVASGATEIPAMVLGSLMPNPNLHWEQKTEFNAGLDGSLLRNRVAFTVDAYRSTTRDLLLLVTVPATSGYSSQLQNVGAVRNSGVELSITTLNVARPNLTWRSTLALTRNRNYVLDLGTRRDSAGRPVAVTQLASFNPRTGNFFAPSDVYVVRVGEPLGAIYGYQVTGLWQKGDTCYLSNPADCTPGEFKIADLNHDGSITPDSDRAILGYSEPKFYGGLSNTLTYGRFTVDAFMNFVYGNKVINAGAAYGCLDIMQANERTCVLDHWDSTHTNTLIPRPNRDRARSLYSTFVEDGSYLRLQTLTLGYELPPGLLFGGAASAQVYVTGQNLFTITGYSGFDPDVNSEGGDPRFGLIDIGAYPRSRVWNFGVRATF